MKYFSSAGTRSFDIYVNTNLVGTVSDANNTNAETYAANGVNIAGDVVIRIVGTGGREFVIDTLSWTRYAGADSNSNGIPDVWELQYFGNLTNTPTGDNDGDLADNYDEYIADTDPMNPASVFEIEAIWQGTVPIVQFLSTNSRQYAVMYTPSLLPDAWTNLVTGMTGSNGVADVVDTNDAVQRMYRVRVNLP